MDARPGDSELDRRLGAIRERTRPAVLERLDAIELALSGSATGEQRSIARTEAHKLNGLLGTIGLAHGSELAASIESELDHVIEAQAAAGWEQRVSELAAELRAEIESR